jgi:multidrug efflux pump subunit AcrB
MNKSGRSFITNAALIGIAIVFLAVYFSLNSLWNAGTIVVIVLLALLCGFYIWLYYNYFHKNS